MQAAAHTYHNNIVERSGCTNVMAEQFIALIWVRYRDFVTCYKTTPRSARIVPAGFLTLIGTADNCRFFLEQCFQVFTLNSFTTRLIVENSLVFLFFFFCETRNICVTIKFIVRMSWRTAETSDSLVYISAQSLRRLCIRQFHLLSILRNWVSRTSSLRFHA